MSHPATQPLMVIVLSCCSLAASAQGSGNTGGYISSGQTASLDCAGHTAAIIGNDNILTIGGNCSSLGLSGSGNKITIQFAPGARIQFVGANNTINWTTTDGKPPKVSSVGSGNTISPPIP